MDSEQLQISIEGQPLSLASRLLGVLVIRLGGDVTVTDQELSEMQGLIIGPDENGVQICATSSRTVLDDDIIE